MILQSTTFTIRPVRDEEDLPALLEVYRQCEDFLALGPVAKASESMVRADLALSMSEGGVFCGIFDRLTGEMIGVVDFIHSGYHGDARVAYLELLMIAAPWRSRGLGAQVVAAVEGEIRKAAQVREIAAGVQVNNPAAIRFWQRMGFHIISGPELLADGTTVFQLKKELAG